jgi:hypothetical protein
VLRLLRLLRVGRGRAVVEFVGRHCLLVFAGGLKGGRMVGSKVQRGGE